MTQLAISDVAVEFGATKLFAGITFTVTSGDRWGIIGRNGTGKTTLFRLLTAEMAPTRGVIAREPNLRVSLLEQHRDFGDAATVWEAAAGQFADLLALERSLQDQATALGDHSTPETLDQYGHDLERFQREGGYELAPRVDAILHGLGFDPGQARTRPIAQLSGGERGRVGLARQLVTPSDVLLLDEPTNHLDLETTRWLEQYLASTNKTAILVSHDRAFLATVVDHVLHFEGGTAIPYTGGYESFIQQRAERRLSQQRAFTKQQRVVAHEADYIARNIAGQNSKQAKGRRKRLERLPRLSPPVTDEESMSLRLDSADRGGDRVVIAEHVTITVDSRILVEDFTAALSRHDVLGIIGPNGAGKSTMLRTLVGEIPPMAGELKIGASVREAYYRQDMSQVDLDKTIYEIIADLRPTWERRTIQGHLGRFGFSGDEVQRRAGTLSGGERARVALAILMLSRANLLILDEPTNHLDVESIEAIEDAIERYDGTVILVSHDRALLRALATKLWVLHDRRITEFDGRFDEWEIVSSEREHAAAVRTSEEEALQRMREKQKTARQPRQSDVSRKSLRRAQRTLEEREKRISELESQIATLIREVENPELYVHPGGVEKAEAIGAELETLRTELDRALESWTAVSDEVEALSTGC